MVEAYTRKSRALGDPDDPELLATHHHLIRQMAAEDGVELPAAAIHTEIGSGETIRERPVFRDRLAAWEALPPGSGGILYVPALARLSRGSLADRGRIAEALVRAGIRIRTPGRCWDLRDPDDEMLFGILTSVDRGELTRYKQRVDNTRKRQLVAGIVRIGRAPFGYVWDKNVRNLLPHPERFAILVECCRRVMTVSVRRLAAEYGVPRDALTDALRNPIICGWPALRWGPPDAEHPARRDYRRLPREQWIWPEQQNDTYPHACTLEEWEAIQVVMDERHCGRLKTTTGNDWCRNVVWFPAAPGRVHLSAYWYTRARPRHSYLTYQSGGKGSCAFVERARVHEAALSALRALFTDTAYLAGACARLAALEAEGGDDRAALAQEVAEKRRLHQAALDAEMDAESAAHRDALSVRRRRLERILEEAQRRLQGVGSRIRRRTVPLPPGLLEEMAAGFDEEWEGMSDPERRALVNAVIARIEVTSEKVPGIRRPVRRLVVHLADWLTLPRDGE